jgi:serine/threonine protein kinase
LTLNDLFVVRKLRSGNFGQVYATFSPATDKKYALKVMDQEEIEAAGIIKYIMNEEETLRETPPHPFLVKFYKLLKDSNFIYILMQLLEGEDMFDAMGGIVPMNSEDSSFYVMQILLVI